MEKVLLKATVFLFSVIVINNFAQAACSYSAYVDFGPAMTNGRLDLKENVYRSSGLVRNIRAADSRKNFRAAYTSYMQLKSGDFEVVNIGPYDTEVVAYSELKALIASLVSRGFSVRTANHSFPALLIFNSEPC